MITPNNRPLLLVVSAPSGAGKTTLCERLLREDERIVYSVSCTTRKPRAGEVEGESYIFLPDERFRALADQGEFLEFAQVHDYWYGTLKSTVRTAMAEGKDVLMDVDVQGAEQLRSYVISAEASDPIRRGYIDLFIAPPSMDELERRIVGRGTDTDEVISRRLHNAKKEMDAWSKYQFLLLNDDLDVAFEKFKSIVRSERLRISGSV